MMKTVYCPTCGISHGFTRGVWDRANKKDEKLRTVTCPNGHGWYYTGDKDKKDKFFGTETHDLSEVPCLDCGIMFGMPLELEEVRKKDGKTFFCPNGHGQYFTKPEKKAPAVRCNDEDREKTLTHLSGAFQDGQLSHAEFSERMSSCLVARTREDLDALTKDLDMTRLTGKKASRVSGASSGSRSLATLRTTSRCGDLVIVFAVMLLTLLILTFGH